MSYPKKATSTENQHSTNPKLTEDRRTRLLAI